MEREEPVLPREVYALLAQANLMRMRGHWEEAAQSCMDALRLAPDSSSANSLLGDIYENQGRYDDAAQWYRMALDVNPDSPADHLKLDRLRQREDIQREQSPSAFPSVPKFPSIPKIAVPLPQTRSASAAMVRDPEFALRVGAIVAALALTLVVAFAYRMAHHTEPMSVLGLGGDAVVKSAPVVVPPVAGTLPTDPNAVPAHDPAEQALLTSLQSSRDLNQQGIVVYDVQADPRSGRMTITFGLPSSPGMTQGEVARGALRVLEAAGSEQSADAYTARCLLLSKTGAKGAILAFLGDATRDTVQTTAAAGVGLTDAQAEAVFTNIWWSLTADVRA